MTGERKGNKDKIVIIKLSNILFEFTIHKCEREVLPTLFHLSLNYKHKRRGISGDAVICFHTRLRQKLKLSSYTPHKNSK